MLDILIVSINPLFIEKIEWMFPDSTITSVGGSVCDPRASHHIVFVDKTSSPSFVYKRLFLENVIYVGKLNKSETIALYNNGAFGVWDNLNGPALVHARVRALLRGFDRSDVEIEFGRLKINDSTKSVFFEDKKIPLSGKAFDILLLLVSDPRKVFYKEEILNSAWNSGNSVSKNSPDIYIFHIRAAFKKSGLPNPVDTIRSIGYKISSLVL